MSHKDKKQNKIGEYMVIGIPLGALFGMTFGLLVSEESGLIYGISLGSLFGMVLGIILGSLQKSE
ncbi:hypothetical protein [Poriferisphaera sp. WC338]|uniref:hypothetical protein n=1 Tax=Poriferisphaera sp. WC338 TaxID=3425129 RepID=UPI003D81663E